MPEPFHICFTFLGDIQYDSRLYKCAKSLLEKGFRVSAVTTGEKGRQTSTDPSGERLDLPGINLKCVSLPQVASGKRRFLSFYLKSFWPTLRTNANCYFASDLYSLPVAYLAAKLRHAKLAYDSRELYSSIAGLHQRRRTQRFWSYVERKIIPHTDVVFTVNDSLAESISDRYSVEKPTTLLNCPPRQTVQKSDRLRTILSIPQGARILLYQGGLQSGRGIHIMLSAMKKVSDAVLVLIGSGKLRSEILEIIKREKLDQKVFLLDAVPVTQLLSYTSSADVGLCLIENLGASYYYSLPNKLFEYVAAGVPVVASNFPEIASFVDSNKVGLVVEPAKEDEVVRAIEQLLANAEMHREFVNNCVKAANRYTWENESLKLIRAIENLSKR
jgi:glycosyltransferase involved in cell wall biosynthesis